MLPCKPPPPEAWANGNGYYRLTIDGRRVYAHRHAYEAVHGPIPDELRLDHLCHNDDPDCPGGVTCAHRACCEPSHLEPASDTVNILRGKSPAAVNARKVRCPAGHEYQTAADGTRRCPVCRYERRVAAGEILGLGRPENRTECPKGHPYTEENTRLIRRPDGSVKQRVCRECGRQDCRERRAAKRAAAEGGGAQ